MYRKTKNLPLIFLFSFFTIHIIEKEDLVMKKEKLIEIMKGFGLLGLGALATGCASVCAAVAVREVFCKED